MEVVRLNRLSKHLLNPTITRMNDGTQRLGSWPEPIGCPPEGIGGGGEGVEGDITFHVEIYPEQDATATFHPTKVEFSKNK